MMQVQKGQVKYKDRSDIICTYGVNDAGKQYYFLDGEKLKNGNLIASTALVEAIDPLVVASNVGVISGLGEVVIPFENKSIKIVTDNAILVEKSIPSTPSVIEAINMRKEPLAATKLVTTPATIKDRMNAKMGVGGRFVFNDQFSEASIFDLDGNNLLNNEYYSFIGLNNGILYMSKNTVDSEVLEYKLDKEDEKPTPEELLDVQEAKVLPGVIDKAMQETVPQQTVTPTTVPVAETVAPSVVENVEKPMPPIEQGNVGSTAAPVIPNTLKPIDEPLNKLHPINFQGLNSVSEFKEGFVDNDGTGENKEDDEPTNLFLPKKPERETRVSLFEGLKFDDDSNLSTVDEGHGESIISDTAAMLDKLIKKNKEQKEKLIANETKINDLLTFKRQAFDENQSLVKENESLKSRIKELETELSTKSNKLENLNAQVAKTDDLAKLLADARNLLDE